jgi:hypothetical protein
VIAVGESGAGLTGEHQHHVFDAFPFHQARRPGDGPGHMPYNHRIPRRIHLGGAQRTPKAQSFNSPCLTATERRLPHLN